MRTALALVLAASGFFGGLSSVSAQTIKDPTTGYSAAYPPPVAYYQPAAGFPDQQLFGSMRFDKLEWNGPGSSGRWDMESFIGGDYDKLFLKTEGSYDGRAKT
jgi:copper resistance protein B